MIPTNYLYKVSVSGRKDHDIQSIYIFLHSNVFINVQLLPYPNDRTQQYLIAPHPFLSLSHYPKIQLLNTPTPTGSFGTYELSLSASSSSSTTTYTTSCSPHLALITTAIITTTFRYLAMYESVFKISLTREDLNRFHYFCKPHHSTHAIFLKLLNSECFKLLVQKRYFIIDFLLFLPNEFRFPKSRSFLHKNQRDIYEISHFASNLRCVTIDSLSQLPSLDLYFAQTIVNLKKMSDKKSKPETKSEGKLKGLLLLLLPIRLYSFQNPHRMARSSLATRAM